jgi:predicted NUDIX family phosphoesterase
VVVLREGRAVSEVGKERVLVVPTRVLHAAGLFHGFSPRVEHYLPLLLDPAQLSFRARSEVETDPSYKQLIPYAVLECGGQVFSYVRGGRGGEGRLHALRSLGVGGHVSAEDAGLSLDPYREGMRRELAEEVELGAPYEERCIGLINDDSTPVGQVHLGIVHVLRLERPEARPRDPALTATSFSPLGELRRHRAEFETWSQFLLAEGIL